MPNNVLHIKINMNILNHKRMIQNNVSKNIKETSNLLHK